jgi:hypothetical protein
MNVLFNKLSLPILLEKLLLGTIVPISIPYHQQQYIPYIKISGPLVANQYSFHLEYHCHTSISANKACTTNHTVSHHPTYFVVGKPFLCPGPLLISME